jgi:hypothetical protein
MSEWKLKRGNEEWPIADAEMLKQWATDGRVNADDYVFNPILEKWMYARDAVELAGVFEAKTQSVNRKTGCSVSILGALLCLLFWPLGVIVLAIGLVMWGVAEAKGGK